MMAVVTRWGHTGIYATLCEWGMKRLCLARPDQIGKAIRVIVVNMFIRSFVRSFIRSFVFRSHSQFGLVRVRPCNVRCSRTSTRPGGIEHARLHVTSQPNGRVR